MTAIQSQLFRKWIANLGGAALLFAAAAVIGSSFESFILITLAVWLLLVLSSIAIWEKTDNRPPSEWLMLTAVVIVLTLLSFGFDCLVGSILSPGKSWIQAGTQSFGFLFTLFGMGAVICCLAGALRAWILLSGNKSAEQN